MRRILHGLAGALLRGRDERHQREALRGRRENGAHGRCRAGSGARTEPARAQSREPPALFLVEEPGIESVGDVRSVGTEPDRRDVLRERAELLDARSLRRPAWSLEGVRHRSVGLAARERSAHRVVVGDGPDVRGMEQELARLVRDDRPC